MKKFLLSLAVGAALATSAQAATISVGTEATFAPFEFMDEQTKELTGFDMEIIKVLKGIIQIQDMEMIGQDKK